MSLVLLKAFTMVLPKRKGTTTAENKNTTSPSTASSSAPSSTSSSSSSTSSPTSTTISTPAKRSSVSLWTPSKYEATRKKTNWWNYFRSGKETKQAAISGLEEERKSPAKDYAAQVQEKVRQDREVEAKAHLERSQEEVEKRVSKTYGYLTEEQLQSLKKLFTTYDIDGGGTISRDELKAALLQAGRKVDDMEVDNMMSHVDKDKSGTIDFFEFLTLMAPASPRGQHSQLSPVAASPTSSSAMTSPVAISPGSAVALFSKLQAYSHLTKEQVQKYREIFESYDVDGGGSISADELKGALLKCGKQVTDAQLALMVEAADEDGSGEIEFEEFLNMVAPSHKSKVGDSERLKARNLWMSMDPTASLTEEEKQAYKQVFDEFDRDGGGSIDVTELREAFWALGGEPSLQEVAAIMKEIDTDGNGTLDFKEFLQITHPKVVDDIKELEETFAEWDKDKDGYLSSVELVEYFNSIGSTGQDTKSSGSSGSGSNFAVSAATSRRPSIGATDIKLGPSRNSNLNSPTVTPTKNSRRSTAFINFSDSMVLVREIMDQCEDPRGLSFDHFVQMLTT